MHYRNSSRASEVDRAENAKARQWIERTTKAKGIQSAVDVWRYILRYYLDSSHSDLMRDAAEVVEKRGEGIQEMHVPPVTYRTYVDDYFLSIWQAAPEEEFILTHNAFVPPAPTYAGEEDPFTHPKPLWKRKIDSFAFTITKLTQPQTLELNSVVLSNLEETGSLTFWSGMRMLRTAQAFRCNFPSSHLVIPLIGHLTASMKKGVLTPPSSVQSSAAAPDEDFDPLSLGDLVLYVLLMQICSGRKHFLSAYDRAHFILKIMTKAKPTSFAREINRKVLRAFKACRGDVEDGMSFAEGVNPAPLLSSIPCELSSQLFQLMIPYMSKRGAVMSGGEGTLEVLQHDIAVVSFLQRASCSPGVWHALSHSSPEALKILSRLFKKDTPADGFIAKFSSSGFSSCYDRAYALRTTFGMAGPTTKPISQRYYKLMAFIIQSLNDLAMLGFPPKPYSSRSRKRPKAQLVRNMPKAHSDLLIKNMKKFLRVELSGYRDESGEDTLDETTEEWVDEMAIVGCLAWLGKHRRNFLDFILDGFPQGINFKLFEDEEATARST
ncbi:hypothetical protein F4604DRAFT_1914914 [Suillus subluteus]|nr:hypothetical protein F4604DRAFT_1914914 [Suillus subluteus]